MNDQERQLKKLDINAIEHLCHQLGTNLTELERICKSPERFYWQRTRCIKGKQRRFATPKGRLREILDRLQALLQRILLPDSIHGGRRGHSNLTNAQVHQNQEIILKLDAKNFFDTVSHRRIYGIFCDRLGCKPDIARLLTQLTTLNGCLPQGSPTSPILAAIAGEKMAKRLQGLAQQHGARHSVYVDDITISGSGHLVRLRGTVGKIIQQEGFLVNDLKTQEVMADREQVVTGVRVNHGLDVPRAKIDEIRAMIAAFETRQAQGKDIPLSEVRSAEGKIQYIRRLNKGAAKHLHRRLCRSVLSSRNGTARKAPQDRAASTI